MSATRPPGCRLSSLERPPTSLPNHAANRFFERSALLALGALRVAGMDGLDDHPATGAGPTSLALRLPPATVGRIVHEVEDAPASGHLVLPAGEGLAFECTRPPGGALQSLLPGREGRRVPRQLVVGDSQRVRFLGRPAGPGIGDALVCRDDLPLVRARRTRKALRSRQCSAGLRAPELDRGTGGPSPEELAQLRVGVDLRGGPPSLDEARQRLEVVDLGTGSRR